MRKYTIILFAFISSFAYSQYDFQQLCLDCAEQNGFYCGDDPANWTQYSPNGCVPNGPSMFYLNDGWEDCVDGSDEAEAAPTVATDCAPPPPPPCDTVYVDVIQYETIFDTIINTEYVYEIIIDTVEVEVFVPEFIYVTDTVYVDCESGLPCNSNMPELLNKSKENSVIYNINGQAIKEREGLYIEDGKVKFLIR